MKLHLPKSLRAALLACLSVLSPVATTVSTGTIVVGALSFALSSTAEAATYTIDGTTDEGSDYTDGENLFTYAGADDVVIMNLNSTTSTSFWMYVDDNTIDAGEIQVESWVMTNGSSSRVYTISSKITGSGDISWTAWGDSNNCGFIFTGDMSEWSGDFLTYSYGEMDLTVTGVTSTAASGTGTIDMIISSSASEEYLTYGFTGATTIANESISAPNVAFTAGGTYTVNCAITAGYVLSISDESSVIMNGTLSVTALTMAENTSLTISAGQTATISSFTLGDDATIANAGTLTLSGAFVFTDDTYAISNTGELIISSGSTFDITAVTSFDVNDDGSYSITLFEGGGTVTLADEMTYEDVFTAASLVGKDVVSFDDGVLTFTELATIVYSLGGEVDWCVDSALEDGGVIYNEGLAVTFDSQSADVNLTSNVTPSLITVTDDITVSLSSEGGYVLNCATVYLTGSSTLKIDSAIFGDTLSFTGSSTSSTLQVNVASGTTYTDTSILTTYEGNLVVDGSVALSAAWSADGYRYNFESVTLLDDSSLHIGALTIDTNTSFANSSASSTLTLYSVYSNSTTYDTIIGGYQGNLVITSGRYNLSSGVDFDVASLTLNATSTTSYAQFQITGSTLGSAEDTRAIYLNGISDQTVTLYMYGGTLYADVYNSVSGTIDVASGYVGYIYGTITDTASTDAFIKTGSGELVVDGTIDLEGTLYVNTGTLTVGNLSITTNSLGTSSINFGDDGSLSSTDGLTNAVVDGLNIALSDSSTINGSLSLSNTTISGSTLNLVSGSSLALDATTIQSTLSLGESASIAITGVNTLGTVTSTTYNTLSFTGEGSVSISKLDGFAGALSGTEAVTLNTIAIDSGFITKVTGTVTAGTLAMTGEGALDMSTVILAGGSITMTVDGTASIATLTVTESSTLNYIGTSSSLFDIDSITVADDAILTVVLSQYTSEQLAEDIDLGISSTISTDQIIVYGYSEGDYTLSMGTDGTWVLNVGGTMPDTSAMWDQNWGSDVVSNSPGNISTVTSDESLYLGDSSYAYDVDGTNTVAIIFSDGGTASSPISIIGGLSSDISGEATSMYSSSDTWIQMTGGYVDVIVGGNVASNWDDSTGDSSGQLFNYTGDTHIMYVDGELGYIIGGTHKDGGAGWYGTQNVTFTGNSYISVYNTVTGAIIGGNTSVHGYNGSPVFTGDTNVYVYVPQSYTGTAATLATDYASFNAVIGGSATFYNNYATITHNGNTNVTIDLSDYDITGGDEDTFAFMIVGGSYSTHSYTYLVNNGDTNVNITSAAGVSFTNMIVGGSYITATSSTSSIETSTVTIDGSAGGTFSGMIIGGTYASSTNTTSTDSSNVVIYTSDELSVSSTIYGGNYAGASTVDSVNTSITIANGDTDTGASFSGMIIGGNYGAGTISGSTSIDISGNSSFTNRIIGGSQAESKGAALVVEETSISISGGTFSSDVIGGNYNSSSYTSDSTNYNTVGDITIDISGGSFSAYIYGGSYISKGNVLTDCYTSIGDVSITISGDASLTNISGGSYVGSATIIQQGNISITLESGSISGSVYAAGLADATQDATWTTESTSVTVGSAFTFGSASTVSGFYRLTNNSVTSDGRTITNGSTLNFSDEDTTYDNLSTTTFTYFDTVDVASGSVVDLSATTTVQSLDDTLLTKTGAGSLTLAGSSEGSLAVEGGTLILGESNSLTDVSVDAGASLVLGSGSTISGDITLNGGSLTSTGLSSLDADVTLTAASAISSNGTALQLNSTITYDGTYVSGSFLTIDLTGSGAITLGTDFELDFSNLTLEEGSYDILTGLDADFSASSITSDMYTGLDSSDYDDYIVSWTVEGDTLTLSLVLRTDDIYWDGVDGSVWENGGTTWDDGADTERTFTNSLSVIFDDSASNTTVEVADAGVSVNNMTVDGSTYSFTNGDIAITGSLKLSNSAIASFDSTVLFNADSSISISESSSLTLNAQSGITVIDGFSNAGSFSSNEGLTVNGDFSNTGAISMDGQSLTIDGDASAVTDAGVIVAGSLTLNAGGVSLSDGTVISGALSATSLVTDGTVSIGSSASTLTSLTIADDSTLTMTSGSLTVASLDNSGTLDLGTNSLTLTSATSNGGNITAASLTLVKSSVNVFDALVLDGDLVTNTATMTLGNGTIISGDMGGGTLTISDDSTVSVGSNEAGLKSLTVGTDSIYKLHDDEYGMVVGTSGFVNYGTVYVFDSAEETGFAKATFWASVTTGGILYAGDVELQGTDNTFTNLYATGDVVTTGTTGALTLSDGGTIAGSLTATSLSVGDGGLTVGSLVSTALSSLTNGTGTLSIDGTGADTVTVADLDNSGTISMSGYSLDITTVTAGGNLTAASLTLGGDASFGALTVDGAISGSGDLTADTLSGATGLVIDGVLVVGDSVSITGADTVEADGVDITGSLTLDAASLVLGSTASDVTINLTVAGDVTTGAALTVDGDMSVGGSSLTLGGALVANSLSLTSTIDTSLSLTFAYQVAANAINVSGFDLGSINTLNVCIADSYLEGLNIADGGSLTLISTEEESITLESLTLNGGLSYDVEDGTLTISVNGGDIILSYSMLGDVYISGEGSLTDYIGANDGSATIKFEGGGEAEIIVGSEIDIHSLYINDASEEAKKYTVSGDAIDTDSVTVVQGSMSLENTVTTEAVTIGSDTEDTKDAVLIVGEDGSLTTDTMTVTHAESTFTNEGTTTVEGALTVSDGATLSNEGTLTFGTGSSIEALTSTAASETTEISTTTVAAYSTDVTIGTFDNQGKLIIGDGAEVTIGTGIAADEENGNLGDVVSLDNLTIGTGATLTVKSGSILSIVDGDEFTNDGTIVTDELTANQYDVEAGNVTTDHLIVDNSVNFNELSVSKITFNTLTAVGTSTTSLLRSSTSIVVTPEDNAEYLLTADQIVTSASTIELDLSSVLVSGVEDGNYYLIENTTNDISWSDFTYNQDTEDAITDLFNNDNQDVFQATTEDGDLVLVIAVSEGYTWVIGETTADTSAGFVKDDIYDSTTGELDASVVAGIDNVLLAEGSTEIDFADVNADELTLNNLSDSGTSGDYSLSLVGDGADDIVNLVNDKVTSAGDITAEGLVVNVESNKSTITLDDGSDATTTGSLSLSSLELVDSDLVVKDDANISIGTLTMDSDSTLTGTVTLGSGTSNLAGTYTDATLVATSGSVVSVDVASASGLTITGSSGTYTLNNTSDSTGALGAIDTTGANVNLGTVTDALVLNEESYMTGGTLSIDLDASSIGDDDFYLFRSNTLNLDDVTIALGWDGDDSTLSNVSTNAAGECVLIDLGEIAGTSTVVLDASLAKYFVDASLNGSGEIVATRNDSYYNNMAETENGTSGLNLVSKALATTDLDAVSNGDMGKVYTDLDTYMASGNTQAADTLAAAVAGATTTALGSAMMADVERQLRSTRNRTRSMGVDPTVVNPDMPYFNVWIAAEGSSSELDADGTFAGHTLSNVGGAIGVEADLTDKLSMGISFTALMGELSSEGADTADGDFDTMYASVYARINSGRWTHSFVATYGMLDATLDRTVRGDNTSYTTSGTTDGTAMALMYEVGYTIALTEDASTCIQPLFSMSFINSSVSGYTEKGSDANLIVGDQDNSYMTFGVGAALETVVGENIYNRASVLSTRLMLKADAGERTSEADVSLSSNSGASETIKGAEVGAVGVEFGLGITIPVTEEVGAIFADFSIEARSGMTSVSGTVGYRFTF